MKASIGLILAGAFLGSSCHPSPVLRREPRVPLARPVLIARPPTETSPEPGNPVPETTQLPKSPIPRHPVSVRNLSYKEIDFTFLTFDRRDYELKVVDQLDGPGSRFDSAREAAGGAPAAINGGFFGPDGEPVGLVISGGERRGYFNSTSYLGTGILNGKSVSLATRTSYRKSSELLQSGPRLVWRGKTLTGLSGENLRPRSFLIWDGAEHFGLAYADSASLRGVSEALQNLLVPGFTINYALNLDGGSSCDFYVSEDITGGGFTKGPFFRKKARNYLVLQPRPLDHQRGTTSLSPVPAKSSTR